MPAVGNRVKKLSYRRLAQIEELFALYDVDGSNSIDIRELGKLLRALGFTPSNKEVADMMGKYDANQNGTLSKEELVTLIVQEDVTEPATKEALRAAFDAFDTDGSGFISRAELTEALQTLGEPMSDEEVDWLFETSDEDDDGKLSYEEFTKLLIELQEGNNEGEELEPDGELDEGYDNDEYERDPELFKPKRGTNSLATEVQSGVRDKHKDDLSDEEVAPTRKFGIPSSLEAEEGATGSGYEDLLEPLYAQNVGRMMLPLKEAKAVIDQISKMAMEEEEGQEKKKNKRFLDTKFPPSAKSLNRFPIDQRPDASVKGAEDMKWSRISTISSAPKLFDKDIDAGDICQGQIGNCYMCGDIAAFADKRPDMVKDMFYPSSYNPAGIYGLKWWIPTRKEWRMIVIDDYLPHHKEIKWPQLQEQTEHDEDNFGGSALPFLSSKNQDEFWSSLVEKAFAKLNGAYQMIWAGSCLVEVGPVLSGFRKAWVYSDSADGLWEQLKHYYNAGCFISTGTGKTQPDGSYRCATREEGLVQGHAYSILRYAEQDGIRLLQIRNTWGRFEWNGDWSDNSDCWHRHPALKELCQRVEKTTDADDQEKTNKMFHEDGKFWMSIEDFFLRFSCLETHLPPGVELRENADDKEEYSSVLGDVHTWHMDMFQEEIGESLTVDSKTSQKILPGQGGAAFDGGYNLANSPQFSFKVPPGAAAVGSSDSTTGVSSSFVYRQFVDRWKPPGGESKGGSPSLHLLKRPKQNPQGRVLCVGWFDERSSTYAHPNPGDPIEKNIISSDFISWSKDLYLEPNEEYVIVPWTSNTADWPLVMETKNDSSKPLVLTPVPPITYATARSKFTNEVTGERGEKCPQFLITLPDEEEDDDLVVELLTSDKFDAFGHEGWFCLEVYERESSKKKGDKMVIDPLEWQLGQPVISGMSAFQRRVGGMAHFEGGKTYVVRATLSGYQGDVQCKVTSYTGKSTGYTVSAIQ